MFANYLKTNHFLFNFLCSKSILLFIVTCTTNQIRVFTYFFLKSDRLHRLILSTSHGISYSLAFALLVPHSLLAEKQLKRRGVLRQARHAQLFTGKGSHENRCRNSGC